MSSVVHVLGLAHAIPREDYLTCAFTAKVLLFPDVIQPFGWDVIEYSNEGSAGQSPGQYTRMLCYRREKICAYDDIAHGHSLIRPARREANRAGS